MAFTLLCLSLKMVPRPIDIPNPSFHDLRSPEWAPQNAFLKEGCEQGCPKSFPRAQLGKLNRFGVSGGLGIYF